MDLSLVIDWVIDHFKKLSATTILSIVSTILSIISTFIARTVFQFTKKMSYSKLSVSPMTYTYDQSPDLSSLDSTYHLRRLTWIGKLRGLPITVLDRRTDETDRGVLPDSRFKPQMLTVKLRNNGELASTNIKVVLVFKAYGSKIKYVKNQKDILNYKSANRKLFSKKKIVIKVPYIGADDYAEFQIADLNAQFRETELILCKIKANGHTYFKEKLLSKMFNRVVINHYTHPFLGGAADGSDINKLIGLAYEEKKWIDPYKSERIGGKLWLRNLFVGWRK
ncbi:hypothetical protein ASF99_15070 [Exiguobacterium sp. Leaf187]|uniref:hypothetical protein n=1 Tax=Exiguobacterium sp. Leaf187 TaxID=1736294 RepID=UPI0006F4AF69|nr:hypothetical protein [Exiguobacterium sp. Leaf187]KQS21317.1 hypothetical protein ASF99_15070 [Exiguobacterium sp. Leaf187]